MAELAMAITLIGVFAAVLLDRLGYYQEMAEKAKMESELRTIKTGLQIRLAELIVTNRQSEAAALESEDPIRWLDDKPVNYGGAYPERPRPGTWYFDRQQRQLVYVVSTGSRLEFDTDGAAMKEIRFRARLLRGRIQALGGSLETVSGIAFGPVRTYHWR